MARFPDPPHSPMIGRRRVSKLSVHYRASSGEKRCGNCVMFEEPNCCTLVSGPIDKRAVCDKWQGKSSQTQSNAA